MTEEDIKKYNHHFDLGNELATQVIILDDVIVEMTEGNIKIARQAISHYKKCLEISDQWAVRFFLGKTYQWLEEDGNALHQFLPAMDMELEDADLASEAAISAMNYGDVELAVRLSLEASKRSPNNPKLISNHALNLLLNKEDDKALEWSSKAIGLDSTDLVNNNVHKLIKAVVSGEKKRPTFKELFKR